MTAEVMVVAAVVAAVGWLIAPKVGRVIDGDTVVIRGESCRLRQIDAPEMPSWRGRLAKLRLQIFLPPGCPVWVRRHGRDRYGRQLVDVYSFGCIPVAWLMVFTLGAVRWDGRGRSPLKRWWHPARWVIGR